MTRQLTCVHDAIAGEAIGELEVPSVEIAVLQADIEIFADWRVDAREQLPCKLAVGRAHSIATELHASEAHTGPRICAEASTSEIDETVEHSRKHASLAVERHLAAGKVDTDI